MHRVRQSLILFGLGSVLAAGVVLSPQVASATPNPGSTASGRATTVVRPATVRAVAATVAGKKEQILVNAGGLPLYTYSADTAGRSAVSGALAQLWPPLVSRTPTEKGASGTLSVATGAGAHQVRYNGHFLYTFVDDSPGHVTGQGVAGFAVATPALGQGSSGSPPSSTKGQSGGYVY